MTAFRGDVSQGCVRVDGNETLVVGLLPAGEQFDIPFGHMDGIGAFFVDNGPATGSPVDVAAAVIYKDQSRLHACDTARPFPTVPNAPPLGGLDSGDVTVGYTDPLSQLYPQPDTSFSVAGNPNGLSFTVADAVDPDGFDVRTGSGSGQLALDACGTGTTYVAPNTQVTVTCHSLVLGVVTGSASVDLGGGPTVAVPAGGTAEVAQTADGYFTVDNRGSVPVTTTTNGVESTVQPGQTTVASSRTPPEQIGDLIDQTLLDLGRPALAPGPEAELDTAAAAFAAGRPRLTCSLLRLYAFTVQVAPPSAFTRAERTDLLGRAAAIRTALGC